MSDKTYHYRQADGSIAGVVEVTQKGINDQMTMVMDINDVKALYRYLAIPISKFHPPEVELDEDNDTVVLHHGNVRIYIHRERWQGFVDNVVDLELPFTVIPDEVVVEVEIQANHKFTVETAALLEDHERVTGDGEWAGSHDSLTDAVNDAAQDWDWFQELGDIAFRDLDYTDKTDTYTEGT